MGFRAFQKAVPKVNDAVQLVLTRTGEDCLSVVVVLAGEGQQEKGTVRDIRPLVLSGTFEELDGGFFPALEQYHEIACRHFSNMAGIEEAIKRAEEEKKLTLKVSGASGKDKSRLIAPLDQTVFLTLTNIPATDGNFKAALEGASMLTMIEAGKNLIGRGKQDGGAYKKIASAFKRLVGGEIGEYLSVEKGEAEKECSQAQQSLFGAVVSRPSVSDDEGEGEDEGIEIDNDDEGEEA